MRIPFAIPTLVGLGLAVGAADPLDDRAPAPGVARPLHADGMRRGLGLLPDYASVPRIKDVKVAVLDSGFAGVDGKRPYLPANAIVVEHYDPAFIQKFALGDPAFVRPFTPGETHGRSMAQLVWAIAGSNPDGPQFFLLNANGPTMFRRAVRLAIERKVDVILFSGTFEGAGNFDGRGPIDAIVDEAVAAGVIWVNAAGNSGNMVFDAPVDFGPDGFLRFTGTPLPTALRFANRFDENSVAIALTWNDYRDTEDAGTEKDLDLFVEDAKGRAVGASKLVQVAGKEAGDGETKNPRERLVLSDLAAGTDYRIRVKAKGNNFGPRDRIRILIGSAKTAPFTDPITGKLLDPVEFLDASKQREIYPPADHAGVLTVGDPSRYSSHGPTADGRVKPDVVLEGSTARFSNGEESEGSSNAAAYFAGVAAVLRAKEPGLSTAHIREWMRRVDALNAPIGRAPMPPEPAAFPPELKPVPQPPGVPLSPNQQRALRYAENSMEDIRRQKGLPPYIVMSGPGGTYLIQPGGKILPGDAPPNVPRPAPPAPKARAQAPADVTESPLDRKPPPHAAWIAPSAKVLGEIVRGR